MPDISRRSFLSSLFDFEDRLLFCFIYFWIICEFLRDFIYLYIRYTFYFWSLCHFIKLLIFHHVYIYTYMFILYTFEFVYTFLYRKFILFFNFSFRKVKVYCKVYIIDTCTWHMYLYGV